MANNQFSSRGPIRGNEDKYNKLKKRNTIAFVIESLFLASCAIVIYNAIGRFEAIISYVVIAAVIDIFIFYGSIKQRKKINKSFCPNCHTQYDYEADIAWHGHSKSYWVGSLEKVHVDYELECECRRCGRTNYLNISVDEARKHRDLGHIQYQIARKLFLK